MYDPSSAFTHDESFESSIGDDYVTNAAFNAVALPNTAAIHDNVPTSDNAAQHSGSNDLATGKSSAEADLRDVNLHHGALVDIISYGESDSNNTVLEEVPVQGIEPENSNRQESAGPGTSQVGMTEIEDLRLDTNHHPVSALILDGCSVKAAPGAVVKGCKAIQDTPSDAKDARNELIGPAERENVAPGAICPVTPRKNTCRPIRPSRHVYPINKSPSSVSAKRRHALSLQPSPGVQPITSQPYALSVVVEAADDCQAGPTRGADSTVSESSSSDSDPKLPPGSRKRGAAKQIEETAKRARQCDKAPVSQNLRPRRSTRPLTDDACYFKYNYESVQLKCDDIQRDIDDLDIQLRREVKILQRRFRKETLEAEDRVRALHRGVVEEVHRMEKEFQSDREALRKQLDTFKDHLKEEGLVNLDA